MQSLIHWLESHMLPCFYMKYLGIPCPGCGMQSALIALLKGNLLESLRLYPALIPTVLMVLFLCLHLVFKFRHGAVILKFSFIFTTVIIVIHYIYKMLTL